MKALSSLAATALLGTERRPLEWPMHDGELGALLNKLPRDQVEKALLQAAGVLGACHLAGWKPPTFADAAPAAPLDDAPRHAIPEVLIQTISSILVDGPDRLRADAFRALAAAGRLMPPALLPKALDCGKRTTTLRPHLLPVLGQRGAWLAAQNDAWAFAIGGSGEVIDDEVWQRGSLDQRKLYLVALRQHDAARARGLIAEALPVEGARERTALIDCLATSLSLDDQDLLEATLLDKSKDTRQAAVRLLSSLPESRFMQRMTQRLLPSITIEKKFLRGQIIMLEPPAAFDPEWKSDGLEETTPKGLAMGERAWWLFQIVTAAPLPFWETHLSLGPAELLDWAQKSDWKEALLRGWAEAQARQRRAEWAEAFLTAGISNRGALEAFDLIETLPLPLREKHVLSLLDSNASKEGVTASSLLNRFLAGIPFDAPPLSPKFGRQALRILKQRINSGKWRYDWQLRSTLVELACVLPPELFDEGADGWDITKDAVQPFAEAVARLGAVLDQRRQLLSSPAIPPPPRLVPAHDLPHSKR